MQTPQHIPVRWKDDPAEYNRLYRIKNRAKVNTISNQWRSRNKSLVSEIGKRHRNKRKSEDPDYRKKLCEEQKKIYWSNLEKYRLRTKQNASKRKQYFTEYAIRNKDKIKLAHKLIRQTDSYKDQNRTTQATRRAIKKKATVGDISKIKEFYSSVRENLLVTCFYCGEIINSKTAHIDHVVPLSKGGSHSVDNFCISCPSCNLSKNDKLISEWKPNLKGHS